MCRIDIRWVLSRLCVLLLLLHGLPAQPGLYECVVGRPFFAVLDADCFDIAQDSGILGCAE